MKYYRLRDLNSIDLFFHGSRPWQDQNKVLVVSYPGESSLPGLQTTVPQANSYKMTPATPMARKLECNLCLALVICQELFYTCANSLTRAYS